MPRESLGLGPPAPLNKQAGPIVVVAVSVEDALCWAGVQAAKLCSSLVTSPASERLVS